MEIGDKVLVSPDLTHKSDWENGEVIKVEQNSFVGVVVSAKTDDGISSSVIMTCSNQHNFNYVRPKSILVYKEFINANGTNQDVILCSCHFLLIVCNVKSFYFSCIFRVFPSIS